MSRLHTVAFAFCLALAPVAGSEEHGSPGVAPEKVAVAGAVYDLKSGKVEWLETSATGASKL